jgi:cytochrome P450
MHATPPEPATAPRRLAELPGPPALPLVGHALWLDASRLHLQLEEWGRRYGPLYRIRLRRDCLVVGDPAVFAAALRDRPERFRRPLLSGRIAREMGFEEGLFFANDEVWRRQRRMVMAAFDPQHVRAYFPMLVQVAGRLQRRWQQAARAGRAIDLQADLMRYTVDAVAGLAFGAAVNTLESDDDVIQRHLNRIFPALGRRSLALVPYWRWLRLPADRALDTSVAAVNAAIQGFIAEARARLEAEPSRRTQPANLLEAMIAAADEGGSGVDDHDVAGNVLTMLLAGEDTTANTLAWTIHLLAYHPEALQRAQQEVRSQVGDLAAVDIDQIGALDWLDACASEAMRLKPVAPLQLVQAVHATEIGGVAIAENSVVFGLMRHATLSEAHFPDAQAFRPERWLAPDVRSSAKRVSMPFGAGPRMCPGRYLALLEIKLALAMLLGHFEIESAAPPGGGAAAERLAFSMGPVGLQLRLRERSR